MSPNWSSTPSKPSVHIYISLAYFRPPYLNFPFSSNPGILYFVLSVTHHFLVYFSRFDLILKAWRGQRSYLLSGRKHRKNWPEGRWNNNLWFLTAVGKQNTTSKFFKHKKTWKHFLGTVSNCPWAGFLIVQSATPFPFPHEHHDQMYPMVN